MQSYVFCLLVVVAVAAAAPQREGAVFSNEAIKQAQNTQLIPKDAVIQKVIIDHFRPVDLRFYDIEASWNVTHNSDRLSKCHVRGWRWFRQVCISPAVTVDQQYFKIISVFIVLVIN